MADHGTVLLVVDTPTILLVGGYTPEGDKQALAYTTPVVPLDIPLGTG